MLKKQLIFILFILTVFVVKGQVVQDSLFLLWKDNDVHDTLRLEAYEKYIYNHYNLKNPDSAIIFRDSLIEFAKQGSYDNWTAGGLIANGYNNFQTGNYPEALRYYKATIELAIKMGDSLRLADAKLQTGFLYHDNEDFLTAIQYYEESLEIFEKFDDSFGKSAVYNELGSLYRARKNYDTSLEYYMKSLSMTDHAGDYKPSQYANLGGLYVEMGAYDKALQSFQTAKEQYEGKSDNLGIATAINGLGEVYFKKGELSKAKAYLLHSLNISETLKNKLGTSNTLLTLGAVSKEENNLREAIEYCKRSLDLAKELGDLGNQENACSCLYESYKALGQSDTALRYFERRQVLQDSMKAEQTASRLQQMEFSKKVLADSLLQVEKDLEREMEHQTEVLEKDKNRNIAIGAGIIFLILAIGFYSRSRYVQKSKVVIEKEKDRSDSLLLNILPAEIAEELKQKGEAKARDFDLVSILFTDFKGFTERSATLSASDLITELNHCFKAFDLICEKYGIEKIKTIGDAYMAAGGLPIPTNDSIKNTILAGIEMQEFMRSRLQSKTQQEEFTFEMRLGIHTGPVVAGIVGVKKFQYDIWGDTVNTASRMESSGAIGKVNISQFTYDLIKDDTLFKFESRGKIEAKGKGEIEMWFVEIREEA